MAWVGEARVTPLHLEWFVMIRGRGTGSDSDVPQTGRGVLKRLCESTMGDSLVRINREKK